MVIAQPKFDAAGIAVLAEDVEASFEIHKSVSYRSCVPRVTFSLTTWRRDDAWTFPGLEPGELRHLGESLIKLSGV